MPSWIKFSDQLPQASDFQPGLNQGPGTVDGDRHVFVAFRQPDGVEGYFTPPDYLKKSDFLPGNAVRTDLIEPHGYAWLANEPLPALPEQVMITAYCAAKLTAGVYVPVDGTASLDEATVDAYILANHDGGETILTKVELTGTPLS